MVELRLSIDDFIELTFAQFQDLLIQKDFKELVMKENQRQIMVNAISVVEVNKHSKAKQFKDIEMFKQEFEMYDYILNDYEDVVVEVDHKTERQKLFM